jgi:hypothetical protein
MEIRKAKFGVRSSGPEVVEKKGKTHRRDAKDAEGGTQRRKQKSEIRDARLVEHYSVGVEVSELRR